MAKKLPRGIRENKGTYEARAMINGIKITLYGSDLDALIEEFAEAKEKAKSSQDYRKNRITLNEWFEEWFSTVFGILRFPIFLPICVLQKEKD